MNLFNTIVLAAALLIATINDLKSQKLCNWLTFPLILSGLIFHTISGGLDDQTHCAGGFALGLFKRKKKSNSSDKLAGVAL